jgi:glycerophosphoryl diester phosphodiesterase
VSSRWPFLDHPGVLAFAHRGGALEHAPFENTLMAFEAAVDLGYRYLETDVHVTADGALLAFHDDRLDRVTDRAGRIAELPLREVAEARVGGREPIPQLEELLGAFPDVRVNIDPKDDRAVEPLAAAIRRTGSEDRVCCGSFSDRRLARLRALVGPRLCTSLGPTGTARLRAASYGLRTGRLPAPCVQVPHRYRGRTLVDERFVTTAHRLGLQVHVWTVDDEAEMTELLDRGVDGLMTDRPSLLREVLVARGAWAERPGA